MKVTWQHPSWPLCQAADGTAIGPDSAQYGYLGVGRAWSIRKSSASNCFGESWAGEMIGGPLEDTSGPALNNFVKPLGIIAFQGSHAFMSFQSNRGLDIHCVSHSFSAAS